MYRTPPTGVGGRGRGRRVRRPGERPGHVDNENPLRYGRFRGLAPGKGCYLPVPGGRPCQDSLARLPAHAETNPVWRLVVVGWCSCADCTTTGWRTASERACHTLSLRCPHRTACPQATR